LDALPKRLKGKALEQLQQNQIPSNNNRSWHAATEVYTGASAPTACASTAKPVLQLQQTKYFMTVGEAAKTNQGAQQLGVQLLSFPSTDHNPSSD